MSNLRLSLDDDMRIWVKAKADKMGLSVSEYLRTLIDLDFCIQHYQDAITYINILYNKINKYHDSLKFYSVPLQHPIIIDEN